ncbi:MAG: hypothetical protein ACK44A_05480 [Roseateles sp.]
MPVTPHPAPQQLPLEPPPPITEADVLAEAERMRLSRAYWRRRYRSLEAALADPLAAHALLTCARCALLGRRAAPR